MVSLGSAAIVAVACVVLTPLIVVTFSRQRRRPEGTWRASKRLARSYHVHLLCFLLLYFQKKIVDGLNDPLRALSGDFTWLIYAIEGDLAYHVQAFFDHDWLTTVLNANYLFGYTVLIYGSVFLFIWDDDRALASKTTLNYVFLYMITVPFYLFFNVQVTSHYIPEMRSLLYHWNDFYLAFFSDADPLDNAFPSLHIGIPFGAWLLIYREMRGRGESPWAGRWGRHFIFLTAQLGIFVFSIIYLGVHWFIDILGGVAVAWIGVLLVEEFHEPFFRKLYGFSATVRRRVRGLLGRSRAHEAGSER